MNSQENEMLFSTLEREKQEREKLDFDETKKWLLEQDKWTQDLFRQSILTMLLNKSPYSDVVLEKQDIEGFREIVETMGLSKETEARLLKRFKEYRDTVFGMQKSVYMEKKLTFEEIVKNDQKIGLVPESLDPKKVARKLVIIQSHPNDEDLYSLLTDLKISTYPEYLLKENQTWTPNLKSAITELFFLGEFAQKAFYLGNKNKKYFTDEEIEEIKSGIEKLENKKRGIEPL